MPSPPGSVRGAISGSAPRAVAVTHERGIAETFYSLRPEARARPSLGARANTHKIGGLLYFMAVLWPHASMATTSSSMPLAVAGE
jgi:hypothetical protein